MSDELSLRAPAASGWPQIGRLVNVAVGEPYRIDDAAIVNLTKCLESPRGT